MVRLLVLSSGGSVFDWLVVLFRGESEGVRGRQERRVSSESSLLPLCRRKGGREYIREKGDRPQFSFTPPWGRALHFTKEPARLPPPISQRLANPRFKMSEEPLTIRKAIFSSPPPTSRRQPHYAETTPMPAPAANGTPFRSSSNPRLPPPTDLTCHAAPPQQHRLEPPSWPHSRHSSTCSCGACREGGGTRSGARASRRLEEKLQFPKGTAAGLLPGCRPLKLRFDGWCLLRLILPTHSAES